MFVELKPLLESCNLKMIIARKDGSITVTAVPYTKAGKEEAQGIPLIMTGTAEEMDQYFIHKLLAPNSQVRSFFDNLGAKSKDEKEKDEKKEVKKEEKEEEKRAVPAKTIEKKAAEPSIPKAEVKETPKSKPLPPPEVKKPVGETGDLFLQPIEPVQPATPAIPKTPIVTQNAEGEKIDAGSLRPVAREEVIQALPADETKEVTTTIPIDEDW